MAGIGGLRCSDCGRCGWVQWRRTRPTGRILMNRRGVVTLGVLLLLSLQATLSRAEVTRVDVATHEDTLGGRSFGAVGAYEWITGSAHFALDPSNAANDIITDLKLAPRNTEGRVEFSAELII